MDFDHLFVWTSIGAPEADRLTRLGFAEGQPNVHPGQGTSCRRFFFRNAYLELLWVHDEDEARSRADDPPGLWARWLGRETGASPFGVCFRGSGPSFASRAYRPEYLPEGAHIDIATSGSDPAESLLFHMSFARRPDEYGVDRAQPLVHASGAEEITAVRITHHGSQRSDGLVEFATGDEPLAEVVFDRGRAGQGAEFGPALPLVLRW